MINKNDKAKNLFIPVFIILSSPSGTGKTTLSRMLINKRPKLQLSISTTTRQARPNEKSGVDYYFVNKKAFRQTVCEERFLEHAVVYGNEYGTSVDNVNKAVQAGYDVVFDVDWQGSMDLKIALPVAFPQCRVISIMLMPPSLESLKQRLTNRAEDSMEVIQKRLDSFWNDVDRRLYYEFIFENKDDDIESVLNNIIMVYDAARACANDLSDITRWLREERIKNVE